MRGGKGKKGYVRRLFPYNVREALGGRGEGPNLDTLRRIWPPPQSQKVIPLLSPRWKVGGETLQKKAKDLEKKKSRGWVMNPGSSVSIENQHPSKAGRRKKLRALTTARTAIIKRGRSPVWYTRTGKNSE